MDDAQSPFKLVKMTITYLALIFITLLTINIILKNRRSKKYLAYNICLAQFTYENESTENRARIENKAKEIIANGSSIQHMKNTIKQNNPLVIYGFYALAGDELGVPPLLYGFDRWYPVRNPFLAEHGLSRHIEKAVDKIENKSKVQWEHWIN